LPKEVLSFWCEPVRNRHAHGHELIAGLGAGIDTKPLETKSGTGLGAGRDPKYRSLVVEGAYTDLGTQDGLGQVEFDIAVDVGTSASKEAVRCYSDLDDEVSPRASG
jgi:hypothetical protein